MGIDRPDWGSGGDRALVTTSLPGQTTGGTSLVVSDDYVGVSHQSPVIAEERELSDEQYDMAGAVGDRLLLDCPDPDGMQAALEDLSDEPFNLLGHALATKMPRTPLDVIFAVEDKATLARTLEFRSWYFGLPDHLKDWIEGEGVEA
jgi:hypothetical protein